MATKNFLMKEIDFKKGLLLIIFLAATLGVIIVLQGRNDISLYKFTAALIGTTDKASLSLSPTTGTYNVGDEIPVNLYIDTKSNNVVVVDAYISYNTSDFDVVSINTDSSIFNTGNTCIYNTKPCQLIVNSTSTGKIEIMESKPSPGINTSQGLIATIRFKGKRVVTPSADNITFTFSSAYASGDSDAILDNAQGTDVLSGVNNAKYTVVQPTVTNPLKVKVALEGKTSYNKSLTIKFVNPSNPLITYGNYSVTPGTDGRATKDIPTSDVVAGSYKIWVKPDTYLSKTSSQIITWPYSLELDLGLFSAGDLNNDNSVNTLDWSVMNGNWRTSNASADIDGNGTVNSLDWGYLNKNWGRTGQ